MNGAGFSRWLKKLPSLTRRQHAQLLDALRPAIVFERACAAIAQSRPRPCCPSCRAERPYRHGQDRGVQRYRCRACRKTFNALSGTPLSRLRHRAKWLDYLANMLDTRSVRASARAVGVHRNTSFRWRYRFLRFYGVASRYLPNYLGWRWALDGERIGSPEGLLRAALGIFHI